MDWIVKIEYTDLKCNMLWASALIIEAYTVHVGLKKILNSWKSSGQVSWYFILYLRCSTYEVNEHQVEQWKNELNLFLNFSMNHCLKWKKRRNAMKTNVHFQLWKFTLIYSHLLIRKVSLLTFAQNFHYKDICASYQTLSGTTDN